MITKKQVQAAANQLATDAWAQRDDPEALARADETRRLVVEQLRDDTYSMNASHREWVGSWVYTGFEDLYEQGPPVRTPEQLALAAAMDPILDSVLTGEQRVLVRMLYGGRFTQRETATALGISQPAVLKRRNVVLAELRSILLGAYGPREGVA